MFVKNSTGVLKKVMVCPPTHLQLQPINEISRDWINKGENDSQREAALREWGEFVQAYKDNGVEVVEVTPDPNEPLMVFARDFGGCVAEGVIMGHFREPCRRAESAIYEAKLKEEGVPIIARCSAGNFEGGDFWFLDDYTLAIGVVDRTNWDAIANIREQMEKFGYNVIGVQCPPENLHLDMCFNIVADKVCVAATEQLPYSFLKMLKKRGFEIIDVPSELVFRHGCNVQALGNEKVMVVKNNVSVNEKLRALGLKLVEVDLVEILKAGGGPHCMTFPLVRE